MPAHAGKPRSGHRVWHAFGACERYEQVRQRISYPWLLEHNVIVAQSLISHALPICGINSTYCANQRGCREDTPAPEGDSALLMCYSSCSAAHVLLVCGLYRPIYVALPMSPIFGLVAQLFFSQTSEVVGVCSLVP